MGGNMKVERRKREELKWLATEPHTDI